MINKKEIISAALYSGVVVAFMHFNQQHWIHSSVKNLAILFVTMLVGSMLIKKIIERVK